jgi:hypothetical protein
MKPSHVIPASFLFLFILSACINENTKKKSPDELLKDGVKNSPGVNAGAGTYSINAPGGWTKTDTSINGLQATLLISPPEDSSDDFHENVNVVTENTNDMDIEEYFEKNLNGMKSQLQDFENEGIDETQINGAKVKSIRYSVHYSGNVLSLKTFFWVRNKTGYVITCTAREGEFSKWEPAFNEAVNSFHIK